MANAERDDMSDENKFVSDVREFIVKSRQEVSHEGCFSKDNKHIVRFMSSLIQQECCLLDSALMWNDYELFASTMAGFLYVVIESMLSFNLPIQDLWDEHHARQMDPSFLISCKNANIYKDK
jgi:hypothetical protein